MLAVLLRFPLIMTVASDLLSADYVQTFSFASMSSLFHFRMGLYFPSFQCLVTFLKEMIASLVISVSLKEIRTTEP